ncbi:MAG: flagellar assembly protein FliW [Longimicrobiales bacterium]
MIAAPERLRPVPPDAPDGVVRFPHGLLGFPDVNEYRLTEGPGAGLFWLSGLTPGAPSFLLTDPFVYFDDLSLDLTASHVDEIEADAPTDVAVLAVTVPDRVTGTWTANLQGPVVINVAKGLGAQVVLPDASLGLKRPFRPMRPAGEALLLSQ